MDPLLRDLDKWIDCDIEDWKAAKHQDRREEDYCQMEFDDDDQD